MRLEVTLYQVPAHHRSKIVCQAMARGIKAVGDKPVIRPSVNYRADDGIMVFYGLVGPLQKALRRQKNNGGTAVYVDLGYWGRRDGGRYAGYHKIAVNSRHPTEYFRSRPHDERRFRRLGVSIEKWKSGGRHILIAGMGDKAARAEGYEAGEWEMRAVAELRQVTDRPIVYRPKPSWAGAKPIDGTRFSSSRQGLEAVLRDAHAVVTHHSNVAVDGLMAGIPAFSWVGVATSLSLQDLTQIETPIRPDGRIEFASDLAWCQWTIAEMAAGLPWRHLKDEGLIPC